jgi:hypothetical protein
MPLEAMGKVTKEVIKLECYTGANNTNTVRTNLHWRPNRS